MSNTSYCFDVKYPPEFRLSDEIRERLKQFIRNLYIGPEEPKFAPDKKIPFWVSDGIDTYGHICIKTGVAKKNNQRIVEINNSLTTRQLRFSKEITLGKPYLHEDEVDDWWTDLTSTTSIKWNSIVQMGPYFPDLMDPYKPLKASIIYLGKRYPLNVEEEKVALLYAKRIISEKGGGTSEDKLGKRTKDPVFNANFFEDFKKYLTEEHRNMFLLFDEINWSDIVKKQEKREADPQDGIEKKERKEFIEKKYGYVILDGKRTPLGSYRIEPMGLFMGRGTHPSRGRIKRSVIPEEVTLNLGKNDPPPAPPDGHRWGNIISDHNATWVAKFVDNILGGFKYVRFTEASKFKGQSDLEKYETSRKLGKNIEAVREKYLEDINSDNVVKAQVATVLWLIDTYGIRVGGEKEEGLADTVGATTLRVEHVGIIEVPQTIHLEFAGKDYILYTKTIDAPDNIFRNFVRFTEGKTRKDDVFDKISAKNVNEYLKEVDNSFSAKVFRTLLAANTMSNELDEIVIEDPNSKAEVDLKFKKANAAVAIILNHTRTMTKKSQDAVKKDKDKIKELEKEIRKLKKEKTDKAEKAIQSKQKQIRGKEMAIEKKEDVMTLAINTSLQNYIDPRIIISWAKSQEIDISWIYSKTLLKKFQWAIQTTQAGWNWKEAEILILGEDLQPGKEAPAPKPPAPKPPAPAPAPPRPGPGPYRRPAPSRDPRKPRVDDTGTVRDYQILLKICREPTLQNVNQYGSQISDEAIIWIYPFTQYALARNIKILQNKFIEKVCQIRFAKLEKELIKEQPEPTITDMDPIKFYSGSKTYKELSNFFQQPFTMKNGDLTFPTGEHAFHYWKYLSAASSTSNLERTEQIVEYAQTFLEGKYKNGAEAKKAGGSRGFKLSQEELNAWNNGVSVKIQKQICLERVRQHPDLLELLQSTADRYLLHQENKANPKTIWGGRIKDGKLIGMNKLGLIWMNVRDTYEKKTISGPSSEPSSEPSSGATVANVKVSYLRPEYDNLQEWMKNPQNVYVGRAGVVFVPKSDGLGRERFPKESSVFANPYKIGKDGTREEVLEKYREYIIKKIEREGLQSELLALKGKNLGCWCYPEPCHANILVELIDLYSSR